MYTYVYTHNQKKWKVSLETREIYIEIFMLS